VTRKPRLLIPINRAQSAVGLLEVADAVIRQERGGGHVLGVVEMAAGRPIAQNVTMARRYRALLQRITDIERQAKGGYGVQVRVAYTLAQGVREAVIENESDLTVLEWPGLDSRRVPDPNLDDLVADPPTDMLLVKPSSDTTPAEGVLVPVRGGPSANLALRVARALAIARRTHLTVLHVYNGRHNGERQARDSRQFKRLLQRMRGVDLRVVELEAMEPNRAIAEHGRDHGVVVLGAYAETARSTTLVGSRLARAVRRLPGTVVLAKSAKASRLPELEETTPVSPPASRNADVQAVVDKWFAENTYHAREFRNVRRLVQLKQQRGLTISLGLPTLNEQATIAHVIRTLKGALMDEVPLLDEVVVVDSASTDDTVAIARGLGVPVVEHGEILPELGTFVGKGEALWKSLHLLRGDIVVWCDTDVSNIHPQFVYGIVGPLLTDHRISYVKGFYRRPLNFGGKLETTGGGRVTELCARPLFNLFYPELSGLVQPLAGEYAARRELLERLPFFTGYGVETGHLIDILETFGLNRIAQTDLGERVHRNQELFDLAKMAFAIMQVAVKRLGDRHRIHLLEEVNRSMKLIHYTNDRFFLEVKEIADWERPPMAAIPEYVTRRRELAERPSRRGERVSPGPDPARTG
jgi:glycosyltransferase involved in cell wall biosynthesis